MNKDSSLKMFAVRHPFSDESLDGYFVRLCEANYLPSMDWLTKVIRDAVFRGRNSIKVIDAISNRSALTYMESLAGLEPGTLEKRTMSMEYLARGKSYQLSGFEFPSGALAIEHHQVCPECLREQEYHRQAWSFVHAPVCVKHGKKLIDRCPHCLSPIWGHRAAVCYCRRCIGDLREVDGENISKKLQEFAKVVQTPKILPIGTVKYTAPLSPHDLFQLWLLADIPGPGEPRAIQPAYKATGVPLSRRLKRLELLASAWTGQMLDSDRLRDLLSARWNHLDAISSPGLVNRQLEILCRKTGLDSEISYLIRHGKYGGTVSDALMSFGLRPPRLTSIPEVSRFLNVEEEHVDCLIKKEKLLTLPKSVDEGFDADELHASKIYLETMLGSSQVDQVVGFKGGAKALESMGLLTAWENVRGTGRFYPEDELVSIFDRIFENINPNGTSMQTKLLGEIYGVDIDFTRLAYGIALAVNRGIEVYGWDSPYRLIDISVEPTSAIEMISYKHGDFS